MNGLIKEMRSTQPCQPRADGSVVQRAGINYSLRNVTQISVKVPNKLSAYAGLQLVCEEKGLKVVNKSFPLNVILTKWAVLLKLKTSSEMYQFQLLLTGRCLKSELFSYFCLKKTERLEIKNERERGIESLTAKGFHKRKVKKCQLCIDKENKKP